MERKNNAKRLTLGLLIGPHTIVINVKCNPTGFEGNCGMNCEDLINSIHRDYRIEHATTGDSIREAQRLRYRVYCQERKFEPGRDGIEADFCDSHSRHVVLRHRPSGELVGTVRVIFWRRDNPWAALPIQHVCDPSLLRHLPLNSTGEVSRFALCRDRAATDGRSALLLRLALIRGVLHASRDLGLTHWCAVMAPSLLRLLRTASVTFNPIGPLVEHHGLRQPAIADIDALLTNGREERPGIWDYVTDNGALAPRGEERLAA